MVNRDVNNNPHNLFFFSHDHVEIIVNSSGDLLFFRHREGQWMPTLRLFHRCKFSNVLTIILLKYLQFPFFYQCFKSIKGLSGLFWVELILCVLDWLLQGLKWQKCPKIQLWYNYSLKNYYFWFNKNVF